VRSLAYLHKMTLAVWLNGLLTFCTQMQVHGSLEICLPHEQKMHMAYPLDRSTPLIPFWRTHTHTWGPTALYLCSNSPGCAVCRMMWCDDIVDCEQKELSGILVGRPVYFALYIMLSESVKTWKLCLLFLPLFLLDSCAVVPVREASFHLMKPLVL